MAKNVTESAQIIFMKRLKDALPTNISLVDALADLLQLSNIVLTEDSEEKQH